MISKKFGNLVLILFIVLILVTIVNATDPEFVDLYTGYRFNQSQNDNFTFFVEGNDTEGEYPLNFTYSGEAPPSFSMVNFNDTHALMNFTMVNGDVGFYDAIFLTIYDTSSPPEFNQIRVEFNISDVNDAPNITSFWPQETNTSVKENSTLEFNYTANDPDSIYGDVLNTSWQLDGVEVSTNLTWNYTPGLCDSGLHNVTLVVNDTSNVNDTQEWNVTVNNTNRAPILNYTIQNITWQEDTNLTDNLTLNNFFSDLDILECGGELNLTFSAVGNTSITVIINTTTSNVSFIPANNFFGVEVIYFTASDGTNTTNSNNVTFNVTGVNDAPSFNYTNQSGFKNILFTYDVNATDPDNDFIPGTDTLTYYDNSTIFNINPSTGVISFTPTSDHIGYHPVNISVDDSYINVSEIIYFNISSNSAPNLTSIRDKNATELTYFRMNVTATDADNDTLTFSSNFSRFDIFTINSTAVNFSFLPDDSDVGNHTINITVTDPQGALDWEVINLMVSNVNNAPNLTFIPNQTMRTDKVFALFVSAVDLDDDNLTFYDNASFFNITYINITTGIINFTPSESDSGNYTIQINVSDGTGNDSQIVWFTINNNSAPILSIIGNLSFQEDILFTLQINATDADNDTLSFSHNSTLFNFTTVNSTSVLINFTPNRNQTGIHWINFTVNDSTSIDFEFVFFNITLWNNTPYFNPEIPNLNASTDVLFYYDINATDRENDSLTFSTNSTIFNISNTTGIINFTPTENQVANYSINISVTDGLNLNSTIINFTVLLANKAPNITAFIPNSENASVAEGSSILFNVTVEDTNDDPINYSWLLNGTQQAITQSWLYEPGYTESGFYNLTVEVSDGNLNDSNKWNLFVNDTNRKPKYGIVNQSNQSDFLGGTLVYINITAESGNITLAKSDGTNYFSEGNFTSSVIDLGSSTNITLVNINWKENKSDNASIVFLIRTSRDNITFTNFTGNNSNETTYYVNPTESVINTSGQRYIQYKAILSTNNSAITPTIEHVVIEYKISDFEGKEDSVYYTYIDLDNFFSDLDPDNTLTYNASEVDNIDVSIDNQNRVTLTPDADWYGTRYVVFTATDGFSNVSSNNISLTFENTAEGGITTRTVSSGGGGGGGGGATAYRTLVVNQSKSIELIVPKSVYIGTNKEIIVPITVQNNEDYTMKGIKLSASSNKTDMKMYFTSDYITKLEPNEKTSVELIIEASNISTTFNVKAVAKVTEPSINDSARITIGILENISTQIAYVRDFIKLNPECLELNELVLQAKGELENHNYDKAKVLLDKAIDNCKFLLSAKKIQVSEPSKFSYYSRIIQNPYFKLIMVLMMLGISLTISYIIYNRLKWY